MPQFEQVSVFSSLIFWSVISFVALLFLLKKFAFPPILEILEVREKKIRDDIEGAANIKQEAEKLKVEFDLQLKTAHEKANDIVQLAHDASKKETEKALQDTQGKVRQMIKEAEHEIQVSRNKLLSEIRGYTAALTIASTERILKKTLDEKEHTRIVDETIEEVIRELEKKA